MKNLTLAQETLNRLKAEAYNGMVKAEQIEKKIKSVFGADVDVSLTPQTTEGNTIWQDACDYMRENHTELYGQYLANQAMASN